MESCQCLQVLSLLKAVPPNHVQKAALETHKSAEIVLHVRRECGGYTLDFPGSCGINWTGTCGWGEAGRFCPERGLQAKIGSWL